MSTSEAGVSGVPARVDIYDTTLRDGSQREGLSLTVDYKLRIAQQLDNPGLPLSEGGWPVANQQDAACFHRLSVGGAALATSAYGDSR